MASAIDFRWSMVFQRAKANPCPEDDQVDKVDKVEATGAPGAPMVEPLDLEAIVADIHSASGEIMHSLSIDQDEALRDADPEKARWGDVRERDRRKGSDEAE